jgi:hypothetical protein
LAEPSEFVAREMETPAIRRRAGKQGGDDEPGGAATRQSVAEGHLMEKWSKTGRNANLDRTDDLGGKTSIGVPLTAASWQY